MPFKIRYDVHERPIVSVRRTMGNLTDTVILRDPAGRILLGQGAAFRALGPQCGARLRGRSSLVCRRTAAVGRRRCRLHGGADGVGAPKGNRNGWKHGRFSAEAITQRKVGVAVVRALAMTGNALDLFSVSVRASPLRDDQRRLLAVHAPDILRDYDEIVGQFNC